MILLSRSECCAQGQVTHVYSSGHQSNAKMVAPRKGLTVINSAFPSLSMMKTALKQLPSIVYYTIFPLESRKKLKTFNLCICSRVNSCFCQQKHVNVISLNHFVKILSLFDLYPLIITACEFCTVLALRCTLLCAFFPYRISF